MRPLITTAIEPAPDPFRPLWHTGRSAGPVPAWRVFDRLAPWYARYRPGYPDAVITHLTTEARLERTSRVLDLGCGPGRLAIALAPAVSEVVAIDSSAGMLCEAARLAGRSGVGHRIHWRQAAADDRDAIGPGPFDLAVIASTATFLDLASVLETIAPVMAEAGTLAILSAEPGLQPDPPAWQRAAHGVRAHWFPARAPRSDRAGPDLVAVLRASSFGGGGRRRFTQNLELTLDQAVGLQYTYASCNPRALGGDWPAFETELRRTLAAVCPDGRFPISHRTDVNLATRLAADVRDLAPARHRP